MLKPQRKKLSRTEKVEANRVALIEATAHAIGVFGYDGASVSRITERANLGAGTFYRHFDTQHDIFETVLREKSDEVLNVISEAASGSTDLIDLERRTTRAFFIWLQERPWFVRLYSEAPARMPEVFAENQRIVLRRFEASLTRSWKRGELPGFEKGELKHVAGLFNSMRHYIFSQIEAAANLPEDELPDYFRTYEKLITHGLLGGSGHRSDVAET